MGTTAQKLTYLNETKSQLKDIINYSGASITDDTFRQYPRKLYTQYLDILKNPDTLFNGMPKVPEQTGTELTLNNTADTRMKLKLNPSELTQETTTGKNLINVEEYTTDAQGSTTHTINAPLIETGKTYFISGITEDGVQMTNLNASFMGKDSSNNLVVDSAFNRSFTTGDISSVTTWVIYTNSALVNKKIKKVMLNTGTTAQTYEPYSGGIPQPNPEFPSEVQVIKGNNSIKIENKNKLPQTVNPIDETISNVKRESNNGVYTLSGTASASGGGNAKYVLTSTHTIQSGDYLHLCNTSNSNSTFMLFDSSDTLINDFSLGTVNRIVDLSSYIGKTIKSIGLFNNSSFSGSVTTSPMILNNVSTVTDYVAHQEQVLPLNLGDLEYCKIGDYEDEFEHDGDKWYIKKNIGKDTIVGTENITLHSTNNSIIGVRLPISNNVKPATTIISNYFNYAVYNDYYNHRVYDTITTHNDTTLSNVYASAPDNTITTADEFKTWFTTHNTIIYYILATPTQTEITDSTLINQLNAIEQAVSYDEQTNISQVNTGLPFRIKASAVKNLESIFE